MNSLRALLAGAIDYAGLFPPANLDMETAVENYGEYLSGEDAWALGRFIVPVVRLAEFEQALSKLPKDEGWRISVLGGTIFDQDVASIFKFNKTHRAVIDTIEVKASIVDEIKAIANSIPSVLITYVEIPIEPDPSNLIATISKSGLRAKARTGGVSAEAFPPSATLARFIHACTRAGVPFKATAGLHHPLRATYRLTYEANSPTGVMFGFLNVFIAAGVAYGGGSVSEITAALEVQSPSEFSFNEGEIAWRNLRIDLARVATLRTELATSFGSCSFVEPINDLKSLKLL